MSRSPFDNTKKAEKKDGSAVSVALVSTSLNKIVSGPQGPQGEKGNTGPAGGLLGDGSLDELRAVIGQPGDTRSLRGHTTVDDGGGGLFVWDTTVATDDGGTIANVGGLGSSGAGWRRVYSEPLDPRWFGAVGDGITPDTTAIQRALNSAAAGAGVHLAAVDSGYLVETLSIPSGVSVTGVYAGPLIQKNINTAVLTASTQDNISIKGVRIQAQVGDSIGFGIHCTDCPHVNIEGNHVIGFGGACIRTDGGYKINVTHNIVDGTGSDTVTDPGVSSTRIGIYTTAPYDHGAHIHIAFNDIGHVIIGILHGSFSSTIIGNIVHDIADSPFAQHAMYLSGESVTISGNIVKNFALSGIKCLPYTDTRDTGRYNITGNIIDGGAGKTWTANFEYGVDDYLYKSGRLQHCTNQGTSGALEPIWPTATDATVSDGTLTWRCLGVQTLGSASGCELNGPSNDTFYSHGFVVTGNHIANMTGYGVGVVHKHRGMKIQDNDIRDCGNAGVLIHPTATCTHLDIARNHLVNVATVASQALQVSPAAVTEAEIRDNVLDGIVATNTGGSNAVRAIYATNCTGLRVLNNRINGTGGTYALDISSSTLVIVKRNLSDNTTTLGVTTTAWDANSWDLAADGTPLTAAAMLYNETITAPTIKQTARSTDAVAQNMILYPQAPFASATGTNRNPSNLIVQLSSPAGASTAEGALWVKRDNNVIGAIGSFPSVPGSFSCLWLGPSLTPNTGASSVVWADGTSNTYLNVGSGVVGLAIGTSSKFTVTTTISEFTPPTIQFAQGVTAPKFWQDTTGSGHGQDFTIAAQTSTFTNGNGGFVNIAGGTKTGGGTQGGVRLKDGAGTARIAIDANGVGFNGSSPTIPNISGALSTVTDAAAKAVLTSIIAALKNTGVGLVTDGTN